MVSSDVLQSPRLKVERAYRHIDELRSLTQPLSRDLYTMEIERNTAPPGLQPRAYSLVYRPTKPIPETLALVIGDALHNFRSALDHLCTGIVRTMNPRAEVHFPMRKSREDFIAAPILATIEKALPGSERLLRDEIRPENGANESAWGFHALDNDDKHNLIIPTVTVVEITDINTTFINGNTLDRCAVGNDATKPIYIIGSPTPFTVNDNLQTVVEISFGDGKVFQNEPVLPTLVQIGDIVAETINAFERLIGRNLNG